MPKSVHIPGCGPMVSSTYREAAAAFDRAFAVPKAQFINWRSIIHSLAAGAPKVHPLRDTEDLARELETPAAGADSPTPGMDASPG